ncbi:MAG: HAMP domain-containing histidine kinase [Holophagaceae bacterium]|nr:HAMP domain-containing histidine kinase [Holophagaceae bacterium]
MQLMRMQRLLSQQSQEIQELKAKLGRRSHQMSVLQHVAEVLTATPKASQVADVIAEVLAAEFHSARCMVWVLEDVGESFVPRGAIDVPRGLWGDLRLPAPNPFPDAPLVLFQSQWIDGGLSLPALDLLRGTDRHMLYFVPFEHQLLLLGFAVLAIPKEVRLENEDFDSLAILQRQAAVSMYAAWLIRDLSEQRDTLQSQAGALEQANTALREADQLKSEFLALTSHELRTPLTGILGFTRLVMDKLYEDEAEMQQMLSDSFNSGQHLLSLLNDILDLAKIESGRLELRIEPYNVFALLEEAKPIAEAYPRRPGVILCWPAHETDFPDVMVDPSRLKQVLLNLLSNALKFTKDGSVSVTLDRDPEGVSISVVDTGIGVSPEGQKRLFQKFAQAEGGHAREYGGTGLGLVICKHLMEMMGGHVSLVSAGSGMGTTLTINLPLA